MLVVGLATVAYWHRARSRGVLCSGSPVLTEGALATTIRCPP